MAPARPDIETVIQALGDLKDRCFLTGGASIPFYITDALEEPPRVTLDIDVVIETRSRAEFRDRIETRLRSQGFENDTSEDAPLCRWKLGSLIVDIMPTKESVLGFTNPWYQAGLSSLVPVSITETCAWRILSPPFLLASKCAAFGDRGINDPGSSSDLEDIVSIINGRPELIPEIMAVELECRKYLSGWFSGILKKAEILDVIPYHLAPNASGQQRMPLVLSRMRQIAIIP